MSDVKTVLVGTIGQGIMRSADGGESWRRVGIDAGMHSDALVRTLGNHPRRPGVVFAGTDKGLYHSEDGGQQWKLLDTAMSGACVWALAIDSADPDLMFAGTGTPAPPEYSAPATADRPGNSVPSKSPRNAPTWACPG